MRRLATAINETQSKAFDKKLEQTGMTEYETLKLLVESYLETGTIDTAKIKLAIKAALKEAYDILDQAP